MLFLWVLTLTLWGFDLVMSIDPKWYSGLFGGYFVVSTLYTGFALLSILSVRANARGDATIPPAAIQDVAKLQFAMSIMWMYFFWSQYLVIWYGNVPVETRFFLKRVFVQPWQTLGWVVLVVGWLIPFAYLLARLTGRPPQRHTPLVVVALMGLVAIFLERVFVVFPSVSSELGLPFGVRDIAITVGFLGLFLLSRRWFLNRFRPILNLPPPRTRPSAASGGHLARTWRRARRRRAGAGGRAPRSNFARGWGGLGPPMYSREVLTVEQAREQILASGGRVARGAGAPPGGPRSRTRRAGGGRARDPTVAELLDGRLRRALGGHASRLAPCASPWWAA